MVTPLPRMLTVPYGHGRLMFKGPLTEALAAVISQSLDIGAFLSHRGTP